MDADLKDVTTTIALGSFLLLTFLAIGFCSQRDVGKKIGELILTGEGENVPKTALAVLAATLAFLTGMLAEAEARLGERPSIAASILWSPPFISQFEELFERQKLPSTLTYMGPEWSRAVAASKKWRWSNPLSTASDVHLLSHGDREIRGNLALAVFYQAKNEVFRTPSYFDELRDLEKRVMFSRALVSSVPYLLFFAIVVGLVSAVLANKSRVPWRRRAVIRFAVIWLVLGAIWLGSREAYMNEERGYFKRVYGYYLNLREEATPDRRLSGGTASPGTAPRR